MSSRQTISIPGSDDRAGYDDALRRAAAERWAGRLLERDASLWTTDDAVAETIGDRLGWLDAPTHFGVQIPALEAFGESVRDAGFTTAIVAGMGGSSLAPEVLARVFGVIEDWLEVRVLDSTDPAAIAAIVDDVDPLEALFIVATKSGTTTEPLAFEADAWHRIEQSLHARGERFRSPGEFVVAITDPGKPLDEIPHHADMRVRFLNPPDIGGRYAALTNVGLVPASLLGIDLDPFLESAQAMLGSVAETDLTRNPAVSLGIAIGALAAGGRDKLTFVADPDIAAFGAWTEQLIAESTGKHGLGILPVDGEALGTLAVYGSDRVFVRLMLDGALGPVATDGVAADDRLAELEAAGHPVIRLGIEDPIDLGGEFVRWEVATAIAGAVLGIDPFDQPDVESAKEQTRRLLDRRDHHDGDPVASVGTADPAALEDALAGHLGRVAADGYLAIQAFIAPSAERDASIGRTRTALRDATHRPTTAGYGPRFLHSTGQLHKGGRPNGWFLQLTSDHPQDRDIPGWPYTFGDLIDAQAAGDRRVLHDRGRPVLRVDLGADPDAGLQALERAVAAALARSVPA